MNTEKKGSFSKLEYFQIIHTFRDYYLCIFQNKSSNDWTSKIKMMNELIRPHPATQKIVHFYFHFRFRPNTAYRLETSSFCASEEYRDLRISGFGSLSPGAFPALRHVYKNHLHVFFYISNCIFGFSLGLLKPFCNFSLKVA